MKIRFLGGAEEIGASCALVEIDDVYLLVDCGQRLGSPSGEALPDFSHLEGVDLDAVLITHAHADHIGALPALEPSLPAGCPIFATAPTIHLTKVMLQDSVRIMTRFRREDGAVPLFAPALANVVLERFQEVRWGKAVRFGRNRQVSATWYPAGHIAGAAMIEIRGSEGSILFSGDVSVADQLSVSGVSAPAIQPSILVLESTYGGRLHAHRPAQERRLIERVKETYAAGGSVLFPTFALGRAQEILLLLGKAMREGRLPHIPVFADGLVRAVSKVYTRLHDDLSPWCRNLWEDGLDPIFPEDLPIRPIKNDAHRQRVIDGPPAVAVSSSGMLQGGASAVYAAKWLKGPSNLVVLTGYQDEESPGQALLNLAAAAVDGPRMFKLAGVMTNVSCQVESCWLSAHADDGELVSFAAKMQPQLILPVHGDGDARNGLARSLLGSIKAKVVLPTNGGSYGLDSTNVAMLGKPRERLDPLSFWPPWDPNSKRELDLSRFHQFLTGVEITINWLTLDELMELWRSPTAPSGEDWRALRSEVYERTQPYFIPDAKRPYILHVALQANIQAAGLATRKPIETALALAKGMFSASGLERVGFFPETGEMLLEFSFPIAAAERLASRLSDLTLKTGWKAEVGGRTTDAALEKVMDEMLEGPPPEHQIDHARGCVRLSMKNSGALDDEVRERFRRRTGYELQCEL